MQVLLIRHAQSVYNIGEEEIHKKVGNDYLKSQEYLKFKYDPQYVDCGITELGRQQCLKLREEIIKMPFDVVIVSPLRRALLTCHLLFHDHPSKPHIIVHPLFREIMESSCDIGSRLEQSMKQFDYMDFSLVKAICPKWYVDSLDEQYRNYVYSHLQPEDYGRDKVQGTTLEMLKHFRKTNVVPDSQESMKKRQLKQIEYLKENMVGKRVAIVFHSEMIKHYVGIKIKNCETRLYKIA